LAWGFRKLLEQEALSPRPHGCDEHRWKAQPPETILPRELAHWHREVSLVERRGE